MKSFIHSLSKLVWIKRGFFIRTSFDRLWMEIFPFLFLILKGFYKGFQMRYHLFFNSNGKAVKTIKMFFWKSAMWYIMSMSVHKVWFEMKSTLYISWYHHLRPHMWPVRTCVRTYAQNSKPIWKSLYVEWSLEKDPSWNVNFKLWNYPLLNVLFILNQTLAYN